MTETSCTDPELCSWEALCPGVVIAVSSSYYLKTALPSHYLEAPEFSRPGPRSEAWNQHVLLQLSLPSGGWIICSINSAFVLPHKWRLTLLGLSLLKPVFAQISLACDCWNECPKKQPYILSWPKYLLLLGLMDQVCILSVLVFKAPVLSPRFVIFSLSFAPGSICSENVPWCVLLHSRDATFSFPGMNELCNYRSHQSLLKSSYDVAAPFPNPSCGNAVLPACPTASVSTSVTAPSLLPRVGIVSLQALRGQRLCLSSHHCVLIAIWICALHKAVQ